MGDRSFCVNIINQKEKIMKRFVSTAALISLFAFALTASAEAPSTAPGQNKLQCFDGTTDTGFGGICTLNSNGAKGSATLDLTSDSATGDYAGVYTLESKLYGTLLSDLTQLSYHYTVSIDPQPGNLSYNMPVDTNADGGTDAYLFIDAYYCPGVEGLVDIINDPNCGIYYNGTDFYANWAALLAAYPDAMVATDQYVFIVAERTPSEPSAVYTVNNVKFGKAGK